MIFLCASACGQSRRIFITLDVSESMEKNKYELANYTTQLISLFRENGDQVFVYYRDDNRALAAAERAISTSSAASNSSGLTLPTVSLCPYCIKPTPWDAAFCPKYGKKYNQNKSKIQVL